MRAGLLRHAVTFQEKAVVKDIYGSVKTYWIDKFTVKADIKFKAGTKQTENYELFNSQQIDINIRYRNDINEQMRIKYGNVYYEILFINPVSLYRELNISVRKYISSGNEPEFDGGNIDLNNNSGIQVEGGSI